MRLLERDAQLSALAEYAQEARTGAGRLVLVAGEAGVGKSSLLEQLAEDLVDARWYWGACDSHFTPRPLAPLLDVASQAGGELWELCRRGVRAELFSALSHEINAPDALTVLVIEDVHWADEATLDLLLFLGRRVRQASALVVVTYRDDALAAAHPLRVVLGELVTHRATRRISLPPLSSYAVESLAEGSRFEPDALYRLTGGNPFFLNEVLHAGVGELPVSTRQAVLARVARLTTAARDALGAAALLGARIDLRLFQEVTHADGAVIDELLACGIVVGDGRGLRFRHEIARMAVESAVPPHRSRAAHQDILAALLRSGCEDDARLAFHGEGALDGLGVLTYAPRAARQATALGSHREAVAQYERTLHFAEDLETSEVAQLYDALSYELSLVDRWQDAADARLEALTRWRAIGDRTREGDSLRLLSRIMWRLCRGRESDEAAEQALAVLEPLGPTPELAWAYANLACQHVNNGTEPEAIPLAHRAQVFAEQLGLSDVLSDALDTEACANMGLGRDWRDVMDRALQTAVDAGLQEQAGRAYANTYAILGDTLCLTEGQRCYVEGIAYCEEHDIATFGTCLQGEHTRTLEKVGRWDEAEALCVRLLDQVTASPVNRIRPLVSLGLVRARRGRDGAWGRLDEAMKVADELNEPAWTGLVRVTRAEAHWLAGDSAAAAREIALAHEVTGRCSAFLRGSVAVWFGRITGTPSPISGTVEPHASQLAGDQLGAARRWDDLGFPYEAALALFDSDDEMALRDALSRLEQLGAAAAARLVRQKMRRLGIRSIPQGARPTTRAHPAGLTRREREVLDQLCRGHTNEEISALLFISVKTVDHHVSAILGKLGAPTRRDAAAEAHRLGLVGAAP